MKKKQKIRLFEKKFFKGSTLSFLKLYVPLKCFRYDPKACVIFFSVLKIIRLTRDAKFIKINKALFTAFWFFNVGTAEVRHIFKKYIFDESSYCFLINILANYQNKNSSLRYTRICLRLSSRSASDLFIR